jgi:SAM-dependent methyltransferase
MAETADPGCSERFDARYSDAGYHYGKEPDSFLESLAARFKPGQTALLPADGEGRNGVWLATRGLKVATFDQSAVGVEKSHKLAAEKGVTIDAQVGKVETYSWPVGTMDVVALFFLHLPPNLRRTVHRACYDALRPGGLFILQSFSLRQLVMRERGAVGGTQIAENLYSVEALRGDLPQAVFEVLEDVDAEFHGASQHGLCAVLRVVARKPA